MGIKVSLSISLSCLVHNNFCEKKHQKLLYGSKVAFDLKLCHGPALRSLDQGRFMVIIPPSPHKNCHLVIVFLYHLVFTSTSPGTWIYHLYTQKLETRKVTLEVSRPNTM